MASDEPRSSDLAKAREDADWLREAVRLGDESGPDIPAEAVFAELRARNARKRAA